MQIAILNGIYANASPDFRTSYPINLVPTPKVTGISQGYLRPGDGLVSFATGPGVMRGSINWRGTFYAVMGGSLVSIDEGGSLSVIGEIPGTEPVSMTYGFDRLAVEGGGGLFYWTGSVFSRVLDPDLGNVLDVVWVDGYFMTTDGEFLIVTDLNDPSAINPLKYGSSEADPDPVVALKKTRNEVAAINRHTIEYFDNVGGELFPFQRIEGAQVQKGCIGRRACCVYLEAIAFVGSGFNEQPGVYVAANADAPKISTHEIDLVLASYTEEQLAAIVVESRNDGAHQFLYIHLPDKSLVYDASASQQLGEPVWFTLDSGTGYRARFFCRAYDKWFCGDTQSSDIGYLVRDVSTHWGQTVDWEFATQIIYNEARGALFHELELTGLTGSVPLGENPVIGTDYSVDGLTWSQQRMINAGGQGQRAKRLVWLQQGAMQNWRVQRFRGTSDAHIAIARLEARLEPLAW